MPRKIIDYIAVVKSNENELNLLVNRFIKEGWQPFGSLVISAGALEFSQSEYGQVVVKYEEL